MSKIALMFGCSECFGQQSKKKEELELHKFAGLKRNDKSGEHRDGSSDSEPRKAHTRDRSVEGAHTHQPDDLGIVNPVLCFGKHLVAPSNCIIIRTAPKDNPQIPS